MVIDVGGTAARQLVIGSVVAGALGVIALVAAASGAVEGGAGTRIVMLFMGIVCVLIGLLPVFMFKVAFRPRRLVIEQAGIRWDDPRGRPWAVPWHELAAVLISQHEPAEVPEISVSGMVAGAASDKLVGKRMHIRLDLYPADPGFRGRHPEMEHLWEQQQVQNGYRLPLGNRERFIQQIEMAVRHFQPRVYRGVQRSSGFFGLR